MCGAMASIPQRREDGKNVFSFGECLRFFHKKGILKYRGVSYACGKRQI